MSDGISLWWDLFKVFLLLAGMILLARNAPALLGRLSGNMPVKRQRRMHLIDSLYLGTDKSVHLVEIDGLQLVLGASRTGVSLLTQMPVQGATASSPVADTAAIQLAMPEVAAVMETSSVIDSAPAQTGLGGMTWQSAAQAAGLTVQGAARSAGSTIQSAARTAGLAMRGAAQVGTQVWSQVNASCKRLWQKGCAAGAQTYQAVAQTWRSSRSSYQYSKAPVQRRKAGKRAVKTSRRSV